MIRGTLVCCRSPWLAFEAVTNRWGAGATTDARSRVVGRPSRIHCNSTDDASCAAGHGAPPNVPLVQPQDQMESKTDQWWAEWQSNGKEMRSRIAKLGLAAVLAYGLFDGVTYSAFFVLAFLGYEKSTGKNPAANIQSLLGIVILIWTGNNVTRPLRIAGSAALAPLIDRMLRKVQRALNLPNQFLAFVVVAATFAILCLSFVGLLIVSRWKS